MDELLVPPITNMMVMLTNQCNLRCPYCFVDKNVKRMNYETLFSLVQFLIKNAEACNRTPRLAFFGGEPTLEWDTLIVPIVQYIRQEYGKPFFLSMTTNITLLNEERLVFMKQNELGALYSVDGYRSTMAINRPFVSGASSFDTIDKNIDIVVKTFPRAPARITIHRDTIKNFFEDVVYVTGKNFGSVSVLPNLFDTWTPKDEELFKEQIRLYGDWLIENFRAGKKPLIFQQYGEKFFKLMLRNRCIRDGESQTLLKCKSYGKCGFGLGYHATCDTEGNIFGCLHLEALEKDSIFYLGNVSDGIDVNKTRALVDRCENEPLGGLNCKSCILEEVCDRGCVPNNYLYNGSFNTPPPTFCQFHQTIAEDAIRVISTLGLEQNHVFRESFQDRVREG